MPDTTGNHQGNDSHTTRDVNVWDTAKQARVLRMEYRLFAQAMVHHDGTTDDSNSNQVRDNGPQRFQTHYEQLCDLCHKGVGQLAEYARLHLPTLSATLKYVREDAPPWHEQDHFDWEDAEAELYRIEIAAAEEKAGAKQQDTID